MSALPPLPARWLGLAALAALLCLVNRAGAQDTRRKQEILFDEIPSRTVDSPGFELAAKATSGLPVTFELISGPAKLDGRKLTLIGIPGLVIVRATQRGDITFMAAVPAERAFNVKGRPAAPAFALQPYPVTVAAGAMVVLTARATGEPLPAYQWRKDGSSVTGATGATLTIPAATPADAGNYDVVATNDAGSVASGRASVTIGRHSQTISFQAPMSAVAGQTLTLNASASSGLPVTFRVVAGSALVSGSTVTAQSGAVTIEASQPGDASYEPASPVTQSFEVSLGPTGQRLP